ncbi:MAG: DUF4037 domain-containing protein [Saccharofermentans sp.]|nr:DUF4037 domain-containing protein [Saccharofermentans sp.]
MWNGLKISEVFFEEYGMPMLEKHFSEYKDEIAAGLAGQTSECFGYDDYISRDHDYAPGFCLWLPEELKKKIGSDLQKAYDELPVEDFIINHRADVGMSGPSNIMTGARSKRVGVHSIEEFFYEHTGMTHAPVTTEDWLLTPQMHIAEAVNGKVFRDISGEFTAIRNVWAGYYPADIKKKKVAADLAMAGKTGQFNYLRSVKRDDIGAAYCCVTEFIYKISAALFLLNGRYMPYYKWRFRAMKEFTTLNSVVEPLLQLSQMSEEMSSDKIRLIEDISGMVIKELVGRGWSSGHSDYLLDNAKLVMKTISDSEIASWNIFVGED